MLKTYWERAQCELTLTRTKYPFATLLNPRDSCVQQNYPRCCAQGELLHRAWLSFGVGVTQLSCFLSHHQGHMCVLIQCVTVPGHCPVPDRWPSSSPAGEWQQLPLAELPARMAAHRLGPLGMGSSVAWKTSTLFQAMPPPE